MRTTTTPLDTLLQTPFPPGPACEDAQTPLPPLPGLLGTSRGHVASPVWPWLPALTSLSAGLFASRRRPPGGFYPRPGRGREARSQAPSRGGSRPEAMPAAGRVTPQKGKSRGRIGAPEPPPEGARGGVTLPRRVTPPRKKKVAPDPPPEGARGGVTLPSVGGGRRPSHAGRRGHGSGTRSPKSSPMWGQRRTDPRRVTPPLPPTAPNRRGRPQAPSAGKAGPRRRWGYPAQAG